ncbi:MAG TPA: nitrogen regulation protein NR(I) [Gammaproteobacteria bacterium]|nr:nitrogen regulation protein NR(I) [Gammaproteobacteria bacterium]
MVKQDNVWVIDDDQSIRWVLERALQQADLQVSTFGNADEAINALHHELPDVVITDIRMPGTDGLAFMNKFKQDHPDIPIIITTAHSDLDSAVSAYEGGAFEYLPKPFDVNDAVALARRACEYHHEAQNKQEAIEESFPEIIGEAPAMQEVFRAIGRLSQSNITVLINGESGTGKELVARALHRHSPRASKTFIALNMAAIPRDLLESELFGHERGAFTGAQSQRQGRFEQANGGTLFLDEIGDMPPELQTRLLRVLSDGEFYRVGGHSPIKVNVRIIAATHQNLERLVAEGKFREDLFHRLNVIRIHIPALHERKEDIPLLMGYFLKRAGQELSVEAKVFDKQVEAWLKQQPWPGNVRQLENLSRWLTVMASSREIRLSDLPAELVAQTRAETVESAGGSWESALQSWAEQQLDQGIRQILDTATPTFERILISVALNKTGGRKQDAARLLGWGRNTLTRKLKELDMDV